MFFVFGSPEFLIVYRECYMEIRVRVRVRVMLAWVWNRDSRTKQLLVGARSRIGRWY